MKFKTQVQLPNGQVRSMHEASEEDRRIWAKQLGKQMFESLQFKVRDSSVNKESRP